MQVQITKSYYTRMKIIILLSVIPGLIIAKVGIPNRPLFIIIGLFFGGFSPALLYLQRRKWAKEFDDFGVIRQDGKKFFWTDLIKIEEIYVYTKSGSKYLNHLELKFKQGKAMIFPLMLDNSAEIFEMLKKFQ